MTLQSMLRTAPRRNAASVQEETTLSRVLFAVLLEEANVKTGAHVYVPYGQESLGLEDEGELLEEDNLDPPPRTHTLITDLSRRFRYYRPTTDGKHHFNRSIRRYDMDSPQEWGGFLASLLNEAFAATTNSERPCIGKFYSTPMARAQIFKNQDLGGPDMVYVFEHWTLQEASSWMKQPPWLRARRSHIMHALEEDELPVIPIYLVRNPHFAGSFPRNRELKHKVGENDPGIVIDILEGAYRLCTVRQFMATEGRKKTSIARTGTPMFRLGEGPDRYKQSGLGRAIEQWWNRYRVEGPDPQIAIIEAITAQFRPENVISFHQAWSWTLDFERFHGWDIAS